MIFDVIFVGFVQKVPIGFWVGNVVIVDVIFAGILQKVLIYVKLGFLGWIFCGFLQPSFFFLVLI